MFKSSIISAMSKGSILIIAASTKRVKTALRNFLQHKQYFQERALMGALNGGSQKPLRKLYVWSLYTFLYVYLYAYIHIHTYIYMHIYIPVEKPDTFILAIAIIY